MVLYRGGGYKDIILVELSTNMVEKRRRNFNRIVSNKKLTRLTSIA
jgi:hypothetical protein